MKTHHPLNPPKVPAGLPAHLVERFSYLHASLGSAVNAGNGRTASLLADTILDLVSPLARKAGP